MWGDGDGEGRGRGECAFKKMVWRSEGVMSWDPSAQDTGAWLGRQVSIRVWLLVVKESYEHC